MAANWRQLRTQTSDICVRSCERLQKADFCNQGPNIAEAIIFGRFLCCLWGGGPKTQNLSSPPVRITRTIDVRACRRVGRTFLPLMIGGGLVVASVLRLHIRPEASSFMRCNHARFDLARVAG